jgi:hypothetical protein
MARAGKTPQIRRMVSARRIPALPANIMNIFAIPMAHGRKAGMMNMADRMRRKVPAISSTLRARLQNRRPIWES